MELFQFFLIAVVIGLVIWAIHTFLPIPQQFKTLILWVGIIVVLLILANAVGLLNYDVQIPRLGGR